MSSVSPQHRHFEEFAIRPFQIIEKLGLRVGYERSFKLSEGRISANRYLLGVSLADLNENALDTIKAGLQMPDNLFARLISDKSEANLLLIGFDLNHQLPIYKVYLEYWQQILNTLKSQPDSNEPMLMHRGYKWACMQSDQTAITDYQYWPKLDREQITQQLVQVFDQQSCDAHTACQTILAHAFAALPNEAPDSAFRYLAVSEDNQQRRSFDINIYPAQLTVSDISEALLRLAKTWHIQTRQIERMLALSGDRPLGHISSGSGRDGKPYLSVYYDYS